MRLRHDAWQKKGSFYFTDCDYLTWLFPNRTIKAKFHWRFYCSDWDGKRKKRLKDAGIECHSVPRVHKWCLISSSFSLCSLEHLLPEERRTHQSIKSSPAKVLLKEKKKKLGFTCLGTATGILASLWTLMHSINSVCASNLFFFPFSFSF